MSDNYSNDIERIYNDVCEELTKREADLAPVREEYEALAKEMEPKELQRQALAEQIAEISNPIGSLQRKKIGLEKALGLKPQAAERNPEIVITTGPAQEPALKPEEVQ